MFVVGTLSTTWHCRAFSECNPSRRQKIDASFTVWNFTSILRWQIMIDRPAIVGDDMEISYQRFIPTHVPSSTRIKVNVFWNRSNKQQDEIREQSTLFLYELDGYWSSLGCWSFVVKRALLVFSLSFAERGWHQIQDGGIYRSMSTKQDLD
jgi:hypothetical protein